jgi:hypothetical protein
MGIVVSLALAAALSGSATPQTSPQADPQGLRALAACRLACYDREALAIQEALVKGDLIALDREEVRKTRRSLFGFSLPATRLFSNDGGREEADKETVDNLSAVIKSARQLPRGRWTIELEEGGTWTQIDDRKLAIYPRPGHKIEIRRAALGSYLANVNGQIAIRVRRTG